MSLQIFLGNFKTGKSTKIYENIKNDILENRNVILFVPSFMKVKEEEEYMNYLRTSGLIGVNITTISDYVENSLKKYNLHIKENYLADIDKKLILSSIVKKNKDIFKIFNKAKEKKGFIDTLAIYMDLIRKSEQIELDKKIYFKDKILESKVTEIFNVYKEYKKIIEEKYVDHVEEMNIFLDKVQNSLDLQHTKIYFDGYNNFNISEYKFIEKLLELKADITITLCTDITSYEDVYLNDSLDIFSVVNKTYLKLLKIANDKGESVENKIFDKNYSKAHKDIYYLANNLFTTNLKPYNDKSENISMTLVTNPYFEAKKIAKIILEKIKLGYRYNDFLIYTTNLEEYDSIIKRTFYEYKIPIYSNIVYGMLDSKLIQYIDLLLNLIEDDITKENIIDILKLGLNDINLEDVYILENYLKEFNIYNFYKEFTKNNISSNEYIYDLERLNRVRKNIIDIFKDLVSLRKSQNTTREWLEKIYIHLISKSILKNYDNMLDELRKSSNRDIMEKVAVEEQVWNNLVNIFKSLNKILDKEKIEIKYFDELFNSLLDSIKIKTIPQTMDEVELANINEYVSEAKKIVFLVGVNENKFPNIENEDILFSDKDLEKLEKNSIAIKETVVEKQKMVEFNIAKALNSVLEKLYILIPSSDVNSKSLRKSMLVENIEKIMNVKVEGEVTKAQKTQEINSFDEKNYLSSSKDEIFEELMQFIINNKDSKDNKEFIDLYKYFSQDDKYRKIIEYIKNDENLSKDSIKAIFGDELVTSVSKLELFKKCPFSYFINYSLGLKEQKEFNISSLDIGSFLHEVLEEFSRYLFDKKIPWQALLIEEEFIKVEDKLEDIIQSKFSKILKKNEDDIRFYLLKARLYNAIKKVVKVIATSFNQSQFVPFGYEITFDKDGIFAPIRIKLDEDKYMNIIGKIDRVDILDEEDTTYVRVIDYKSSSRDLCLDDIKEGISLQLITYINAFIKNNNATKTLPAGMLYFNLSNKLVNMKDFAFEDKEIEKEVIKALRLKGIFLKDVKVLEKMDKNFKNDNRLIDISTRSLNNKSKVLEEEEYVNLCKEVDDILKEIGNQLLSGKVKIEPNKRADYCKYCKYSDICRKNICL